MTMTESTYEDKADWPDGPWKDEPDRIAWTDDATGLDCLIRRGPQGALCGYVAVTSAHPWHGHGYYAEGSTAAIEVHGGLTYCGPCDGDTEQGICHVPAPGEPDDVWWFGFDCAHCWDVAPGVLALYARINMARPLVQRDETYRDVAYVRAEVEKLAAQLAGVSA